MEYMVFFVYEFLWICVSLPQEFHPYLDDGEGLVKIGECREKCDKDHKCASFIYK
jgi:hypothetical protein